MALHKIVNGVKVEMTPEEEASYKAEWEANRIRREQETKLRKEKDARFQSALEKLLSSLSEEEKAIIKERLVR